LHATLSKRIVGGTEASVGEFPHQVLIGFEGDEVIHYACGGSLLSSNFVLTAAHCSKNNRRPAKYARLGSYSRLDSDSFTTTIPISEIIEHPKYDKVKTQNDIALMKLQSEVKFSNRVFPGCLPTQPYTSEKAMASGFGLTGTRESLSTNLLKVTLEKFTFQECASTFPRLINETTMLCYGHHTERKDTCNVSSSFF
jgi:Trypsin